MKTPNLAIYDNSWYNPGGNALKRILWFFTNAIIFNSAFVPTYGIKVRILRMFGAKIGKGVIIKPFVNIKYPWNLTIGDYTWIGENVWIDNLVLTSIGSNCCLSQGAMLLCGNHDYKKETFDLIVGEIHIKDGAWIGAKSLVCPNVTIQKNAVLSAYSMATTNLEEAYIYSGAPAQKKRERIIK